MQKSHKLGDKNEKQASLLLFLTWFVHVFKLFRIRKTQKRDNLQNNFDSSSYHNDKIPHKLKFSNTF